MLKPYPFIKTNILIVKEDNYAAARAIFADIDESIAMANRYLGGYIGNCDGARHLVLAKIDPSWI